MSGPKQKKILALLVGAGVALVMILAQHFQLLEGLELKTLDFRFRHFSHPGRASRKIALVAIDDQSLKAFRENGVIYPWQRDVYARMVNYLKRSGARVIVFDMLFPDPDIGKIVDAEETDGRFSGSMQASGNVILGANLRKEEDLLSGYNPLRCNRLPKVSLNGYALPEYSAAVLPIEQFQISARTLGITNYSEDPDGVCRRLPLLVSYRQRVFPQLGAAAYFASQNIDTLGYHGEHGINDGRQTIPLWRGDFLINWYGPGDVHGCFPYYSFGRLIESAALEDSGKPPLVPSSEFRDKIVIIGSNSTGLFDFRNTPFTQVHPYPAMEIQATIASNLMQGDFLTRIPSWSEMVLLLAAAFLSSSIFFFSKAPVRAVLTTLALLIILFAALLWAFQSHSLWVDLVSPTITILLSFTTAAVISYQTEGRERRKIREMFSRYLSPVVISEVLEKQDSLLLGGKEISGTVFFSDVKDFSSIAEKLSPAALVALMNEYFSEATRVVLRHEAMLDKFIGDSIMAVFGAPLANPGHARNACRAALDIQTLLKTSAVLNAPGKPKLITRIGLNSGPMIVGNIGSTDHLDYTAIGDTVNLASRLEGLNKHYGTGILISESTWRDIHDDFVTREMGLVRVVGKMETTRVFELIGTMEGASKARLLEVREFQDALCLYRERNFERARERFLTIAGREGGDLAALWYAAECARLSQFSPPPDWNGIEILQTK